MVADIKAMTDERALRAALYARWAKAQAAGKAHLDVRAGDLCRETITYPDQEHRLAACCHILRKAMIGADAVLVAPPSDSRAHLVVRYVLPRRISTA